MTTQLGKTATNLLLSAIANRTNQFHTVRGFRTGVKAGSFGGRDYKAAQKLVSMGLVTWVASTKRTEYPYHSYGTDHITESTYQLTTQGINLAKELTP